MRKSKTPSSTSTKSGARRYLRLTLKLHTPSSRRSCAASGAIAVLAHATLAMKNFHYCSNTYQKVNDAFKRWHGTENQVNHVPVGTASGEPAQTYQTPVDAPDDQEPLRNLI